MDRRQMSLAALMFGAVLFNHQPVTAQVMTINGNALNNYCNPNKSAPAQEWAMAATCMGYLAAVMDAFAGGGDVNGYRACIPPTADMNQIVDIVKRFIRNHPEKRHFLAVGLVAASFSEAFPCKQNR
jgi:Rap1a immunity proteins